MTINLDGNKTYIGVLLAASPFLFDLAFGLIDCFNGSCDRESLRESVIAVGIALGALGGAHKVQKNIDATKQIKGSQVPVLKDTISLPNGIYKRIES